MEFDDERVDLSGVDDQRGRSGMPRGAALGGGAGVVGLIVALLVSFGVLSGGEAQQLIDLTGTGGGAVVPGETNTDLQERCNDEGALDEYTDCRLIKAYNVMNDTWAQELARRGQQYAPPGLAFFSGSTATACGSATSQTGPFYCPGDQKIYFDLDFLDELQRRFGADGEFAQVYILAHEGGHHLQSLLGIEQQVRRQQQADPRQANALSVQLELQADCFAGVWSTLADRIEGQGIVLTQQDIQEAENAAAAVGDDRIQMATSGRVSPESFTHGTSAQRQQWFETGYRSGDLARCDTFG